jgi:phosphoribosyl 1,2-cyclic phosphodiesterase
VEDVISIRFAVLGSGSGGNCTFFATEKVKVLVDAGFSGRETERRLAGIGERLENVSAILVTHEHSDHVGGLSRLAKKYKIPVYITAATRAALSPQVTLTVVEYISPGHCFQIADLTVEPFTIPHDCVDPVAFRLTVAGVRVALATDLGYLPENVKHYLRGCQAMILESNHDLEMLRTGPYPWHLKQRVMGRTGHLSNTALCDFLRGEEFDGETQTVILAHLSEQNNHPQLAQMEAARALEMRSREGTKLVVSSQHEASEVFEF